jgi:hypothetical protein
VGRFDQPSAQVQAPRDEKFENGVDDEEEKRAQEDINGSITNIFDKLFPNPDEVEDGNVKSFVDIFLSRNDEGDEEEGEDEEGEDEEGEDEEGEDEEGEDEEGEDDDDDREEGDD